MGRERARIGEDVATLVRAVGGDAGGMIEIAMPGAWWCASTAMWI